MPNIIPEGMLAQDKRKWLIEHGFTPTYGQETEAYEESINPEPIKQDYKKYLAKPRSEEDTKPISFNEYFLDAVRHKVYLKSIRDIERSNRDREEMLKSSKDWAELARLKALEKHYKEPTRQEMIRDLEPQQPMRQTKEGVYTNIPKAEPAPAPVERPLGTSPEYQPQPQPTTQPTQTKESFSEKVRNVNRMFMKPEQASQDIQREEAEKNRERRAMNTSSYLQYVSKIASVFEEYGVTFNPKIWFGDQHDAMVKMLASDPEKKKQFINKMSALATKDTKGTPLIQDVNFLAKEFNISTKEAFRIKKTLGEKSREAFMQDVYTNNLSSNEDKKRDSARKAGEWFDSIHQEKVQPKQPVTSPQVESEVGKRFPFKKYEGKYDPKLFTKGKGIYRVDGKIVQWDGQNATER